MWEADTAVLEITSEYKLGNISWMSVSVVIFLVTGKPVLGNLKHYDLTSSKDLLVITLRPCASRT